MNNSAKKDIAEQLRKLLLEFHNFGGELYPSHVGVNQVARELRCSPSSVSGAFKKLGFADHREYVHICSDDELFTAQP
jgi:predicted transcriptional regulator with HTH domain